MCDTANSEAKQKIKLCTGTILENRQILADLVKLRVEHFEIAQKCEPGQFVNVRVADTIAPLLRRPFSINRVDRENGWFDILFKVIGDGTKILANQTKGSDFDFLGPLGNSFFIPTDLKHAILVAGGLGIAPLEILSQTLKKLNIKTTLFWGNQNKAPFIYTDDFDDLMNESYYATDDGSFGFRGRVTELLENQINAFDKKTSHIFSCGPNPMLKSLKTVAEKYDFTCQVSMETMMACGFGACMGCNISKASEDGGYVYVCKDGPVFDIKEIEIDG